MDHLIIVHGMLNQSVNLAMESHKGQMYGSLPYFAHLFSVCALCCKYTDNEMILSAAVLHDVLEDTNTPIQEIVNINPELAEICKLLSKNINRKEYFNNIAANKEAAFVKIADRVCNIKESLDQKNEPMITKYFNEVEEIQKLNNALTSEIYNKEFLPLYVKMISAINNFQIPAY